MFFNAAWNTSLGKVQTSRELWKQTQQAFVGAGAKQLAAELLALEAYFEARLGYESETRQKASQAVRMSDNPDTRWEAAMAWATAGAPGKALVGRTLPPGSSPMT